jgi:hypothetical protein
MLRSSNGLQGDGEGNKRLKRLKRACDDEQAKDTPADQQVGCSLQYIASMVCAACIARVHVCGKDSQQRWVSTPGLAISAKQIAYDAAMVHAAAMFLLPCAHVIQQHEQQQQQQP